MRIFRTMHNRLVLEGNRNYIEHLKDCGERCRRYLRTLKAEERKRLLETDATS